MSLDDALKILSKLNADVHATVSAAEKLGDTVSELINEMEKLVLTKAEVNTITIREED